MHKLKWVESFLIISNTNIYFFPAFEEYVERVSRLKVLDYLKSFRKFPLLKSN